MGFVIYVNLPLHYFRKKMNSTNQLSLCYARLLGFKIQFLCKISGSKPVGKSQVRVTGNITLTVTEQMIGGVFDSSAKTAAAPLRLPPNWG